MKKFTLKDFVLYNGPCFACGGKINIKIVTVDKDYSFQDVEMNNSRVSQLILDKTTLDVTLKVKYSSSLNLKLFIKTNKYVASNMDSFETYINSNELHIISECKKCHNVIISNKLEFNPNGNIQAITILRELLSFEDKDTIYTLHSEYEQNVTEINIYNFVKRNDPYVLETPLLPLYKFRNRENLLKKLQTYVLFS